MWIDSHCQLNHEKIKKLGQPSEIVKTANDAGVEAMLSVCCRVSDEFPQLLEMTKTLKNVWCSIGTHPHNAGVQEEIDISQDELVRLALSDSKIIAIGESGLDYYYDNSTPEQQQESFRKHIRACIETNMPLIVHSRDAEKDTMRIIKEEGTGTKLKGVMHCFSSKRILAEEALDFDFYISLAGIITFKKAQELRDIARDIPLNRLLLETDAPYLAPEPYRGKINQPAYVIHTGSALAKLYDITENEIAKHSKQNFFTLFNRAKMK